MTRGSGTTPRGVDGTPGAAATAFRSGAGSVG